MPRDVDPILLEALSNAYIVRAKLFHDRVRAFDIDLLIAEIDAIEAGDLTWLEDDLGVTESALQRVMDVGGKPHHVFAHPNIVQDRPHLIGYYRNVVPISKKGIEQLLFPTERYESRQRNRINADNAIALCRTLNNIASHVIDQSDDFSMELSRQVILAELGTGIQGTWANMIGKGATLAVGELFEQHLVDQELGQRIGNKRLRLNNGWEIHFSAEPDVAFFDPMRLIQIAIEIKGSLDVAGAQTRYGEAKKSFAKALAQNPRCYTVYLASCFTAAVIDQIQRDAQVRDWFNLTSILYDDAERDRFIDRIFHVVEVPP